MSSPGFGPDTAQTVLRLVVKKSGWSLASVSVRQRPGITRRPHEYELVDIRKEGSVEPTWLGAVRGHERDLGHALPTHQDRCGRRAGAGARARQGSDRRGAAAADSASTRPARCAQGGVALGRAVRLRGNR